MADLQASVSFSNVKQVDSCTCTLAHGVTPSQTLLRCAPQPANIKTLSDLVLTFGPERIRLRDCLADTGTFTLNASGMLVSLYILDRRWKWAYPTISGHYNVRDKNNPRKIVKDEEKGLKLDPKLAVSDSERTPQQLAKLFMEALGERDFLVGDMPNDIRPEFHLEESSAALALQELCDQVACDVVLQVDDRVAIRKRGVGRAVPTGPVEEYNVSLDPPNRPSKIIVKTAPTVTMKDWELEAVGIDVSGKVKLINDLSYKPSGGWFAGYDPEHMGEIEEGNKRRLAQTSVFRWFRFKTPQVVWDKKEVKRLREILLLDGQISQRFVLGVLGPRPAIVYGKWFNEEYQGTGVGDNTPGTAPPLHAEAQDDDDFIQAYPSIVIHPFSIDAENGLVKFSHPIYRRDGSNNVQAPELFLRTGLQWRNPENGAWYRKKVERTLDKNSNTKPRVIVIDELAFHQADVKNTKWDNSADVLKAADQYLDAFEKQYQFESSVYVQYAGWIEINPDGALASVTWHMDVGGAYTVLQRSSDNGSPTTLPARLRRIHEQSAATAEKVEAMRGIANALTSAGPHPTAPNSGGTAKPAGVF